jgi:hypothetical protein
MLGVDPFSDALPISCSFARKPSSSAYGCSAADCCHSALSSAHAAFGATIREMREGRDTAQEALALRGDRTLDPERPSQALRPGRATLSGPSVDNGRLR